jgi:alanine racemase
MNPGAYATVDLSAVQHNLGKIREYAPKSKIMPVIKANAYGHGLLRIAEALKDVDAVAVARVDEAVELRDAGYTRRICVLGGFVCEQELNELIKYDLGAVVHSIEQVAILEKYLGSHQLSVWLKLDTGMNRLGFNATEFSSAYQKLSSCSNINQPVSLMTHFSSADERENKVTEKQIKLFHQLVKSYSGEKSIANSAGIIAWPDSLTDWVRPGIMLYGVSPFPDHHGNELGLKPVMNLYSRLISVKTIEPGDAVGYAGTWVSKNRTRIGVVAIGYGDGYPRAAKTGTPVLVNGKRVPLVGRVSMDMITVDLTAQPSSKPGDRVTLWGDGLPVEEIADYSDTIPYTLLCGVTQRVGMETIYS